MKRMWSKNELKNIDKEMMNDISNYQELTKVWDGEIKISSLDISSQYIKVVRNFKELQFIFNCRLQNATESAIIISNNALIAQFKGLEEAIQNKIYGHNGAPCSTTTTVGNIAYASLFVSTTNGYPHTDMPRYVDLYHSSGKFEFYLEGGNITVAANTSLDFEARISLAL